MKTKKIVIEIIAGGYAVSFLDSKGKEIYSRQLSVSHDHMSGVKSGKLPGIARHIDFDQFSDCALAMLPRRQS